MTNAGNVESAVFDPRTQVGLCCKKPVLKMEPARRNVMEEPSEANLVQLLDLRSADWKHPRRTRAVGPRAWHATSTAPWLFGHGGLVGSPMPRACGQACAAVNHFLKSRFPNGTWTSIAVLFNPRMGLHRDIQNMIDEGDATALVAGKFASVILAWRKKAGAAPPRP